MLYALGPGWGALLWLGVHALGGFGTAFVFIQSHNAMDVYEDDKVGGSPGWAGLASST